MQRDMTKLFCKKYNDYKYRDLDKDSIQRPTTLIQANLFISSFGNVMKQINLILYKT